MNCEDCSELLLDYLDGSLGSEEAGTIKEHLESCPKCSFELEELGVIRRAAREAAIAEPSPEVFSYLSEAARENAASEKPPFWKKWSYSPIVVPALSAAIAISVWFYYGHIDISGIDTATRDVGTVKMSPSMRQGEGFSGTDEKEKTLAMEAEEHSEAITGKTQHPEQKKASQKEARTNLPAAPSQSTSDTESEPASQPGVLRKKEITEEDLVTYRKEEPSSSELLERGSRREAPEKTPDEAPADDVLKTESPYQESQENYTSQINLALSQQSAGDCEASIRTNEALLKSTPPPPLAVRVRSYRSIAECYEDMGELDKAVAGYMKLGRIAPEQTAFVNTRIKELKGKAARRPIDTSDTNIEPAK